MFGLQTLDVAIGLAFIYLLLSLVCTAANELIAGLLDLRAKRLVAGIGKLLAGDGAQVTDPKDGTAKPLDQLFFDHPLIKALREDGTHPSYIPSRTFALALLDIVAPAGAAGPANMATVREAVSKALPENSDIRRSQLLMLDQAGDDLNQGRQLVETWFNDAMDRVSAWYKRDSHMMAAIMAVVITVLAGADTFQMTKSLLNDPALRNALVAEAQEAAKAMPSSMSAASAVPNGADPQATPTDPLQVVAEKKAQLDKSIAQLQGLGIKLGWEEYPTTPKGWVLKIIGLLITAVAVSLGAPFWFQALNKIVSIRTIGKSPNERAAVQDKKAATE